MPARKQPHEFTACEQFGTRYSALGKRIEASVPKGETAVTRTYTSELDIFQLCDSLAVELEDPEVELEYIAQNRRQYYSNHSYMKDKAIGTAYDGPVFPDDIIYRRSSGEKYTVQADGSITTAAGKTYKAPDFQNFIHTCPKKSDRKDEAAPVLTLPKQENPLLQGESKTRTPEEASKAAAKQREQERKKESAVPTPQTPTLDKATDKEILAEINRRPGLPCKLWDFILGTTSDERLCEEITRRGIVAHLSLEKASSLELEEELRRRGYNETFTKTVEKTKPSERLLQAYTDKDLADALRRRGYTVNATKTVEI